MDMTWLKPDGLLQELGEGKLPTLQTENDVNLPVDTVVMLVVAVILIIVVFFAIKKYTK